ncbi:MAG TPA: hypothetical protein VNZ52_16990, partial [Candidatus Thermoplasmatota archaeon]|nr:hypothetical protein [Candidatus Thermoplasmatota archaeon]
MAQIAAGTLRFAVRGPGGRVVTWSEPIDYAQLDNSAAPLTYVPDPTGQGRKYGTINDYFWNFPPEFVIYGSAGHMLEVQYLDTSNHTTVNTNAHTVKIQVAEYYKNPINGRAEIVDRILTLADRVTKDTAGTLTDPDGLKDATPTLANEWSAILRFKPAFGRG